MAFNSTSTAIISITAKMRGDSPTTYMILIKMLLTGLQSLAQFQFWLYNLSYFMFYVHPSFCVACDVFLTSRK